MPCHVDTGLSGAIYGLMFAQISLLGLNWTEMPFRWIRALILIGLLTADIVIYIYTPSKGPSSITHLGGAVAGVCIALVLGRNVRLRRWELTLTWLGVAGYVALVVIAFAGGQVAAGLLGALVIPALLGYAAMHTWKGQVCSNTGNRSYLLYWCGAVEPAADVNFQRKNDEPIVSV